MTINVSSEKIYKIIQTVLLLAVFGLLLWSRPWDTSASNSGERTITVTGEAIIKEDPDEFTFYPYFQEQGTDPEVLKSSLTEKANQAVEKLKELGVEEEKIKLDASSYDQWYYRQNEEGTINIRLTISTSSEDITQEVQDYLLSVDAKGQLSPQATFSEAKKKELDKRAVEEAANDAKSKAEAQAKLFNAKLGDALKVDQGSDSIFYGYGKDAVTLEANADSVSSSLPVLPGQEEYRQTVTVVYELK